MFWPVARSFDLRGCCVRGGLEPIAYASVLSAEFTLGTVQATAERLVEASG